jgi:hypothetical protein
MSFSKDPRKSVRSRTLALVAAAVLPLGCATTHQQNSARDYPLTIYDGVEGVWIPDSRTSSASDLPWSETLQYAADGPFTVELNDLPEALEGPKPGQIPGSADGGRIESQISGAEADRLRAEALRMPPSLSVDEGPIAPGADGPVASVSFDSLDANSCCGGSTNVPPDPELAVGPNHIIAVVNVAFEIYDKSGTRLQGPTTFASFFSGVPGCSAVFDPNVIYDEEHDRFVLGVDDNGVGYCVAATTGSNPQGSWHRYRFATNVNGWFFDYPHAGVGLDGVYMGANMFTSSTGPFAEGRIWAMDKFAMYAGSPMSVVTRSTGSYGTPQPMNLHGWAQGTWPVGGPHYILTDGPLFDGAHYGVWSWNNPLGANILTNLGTVDLNGATGVTAGFPIDSVQAGTNIDLQANDWRVQDAEYRNGYIWMANTQGCNPGGGTVNCVRWAQIDPGGPTIVDAGVFGSSGDYRTFADLAVDDCDNMAVGYTKSSSAIWPSVWVTGRESTDTPGTLQAEQQLKAGERFYRDWLSGARRWGDYTGMTIDPDGVTFWYLGEYSKNIVNFANTYWGTYIGSFSFDSCVSGGPSEAPEKASNPSPGNGVSDVGVESILGWTAGVRTTTHHVYFGTDSTPDSSEYQGPQSGASFDPGTLNHQTTYYWRIDEANVAGTTEGDVWSFTTEDEPLIPTMHLANLSGTSVTGGSGGKWNAIAQITVEDADGVRLGGVTANGTWSNGANGGASCITNASGQCSVQKNNLKRQVSSVTFTINTLVLTGYEYDAGDNAVSDFIVIGQTTQNVFPNAINDNYSVDQDTQLDGVNVMANDTTGDPPTTVTGYENPSDQGGSVSISATGALTYNPPGGFFGTDTFDYTLTDGTGDTDSATVTVQVNQSGSGGGYELSGIGYKDRGRNTVDLTWSGFSGNNVVITRNGTTVGSGLPNSGNLTDATGQRGGATYDYLACEAGTSNCAQTTVSF